MVVVLFCRCAGRPTGPAQVGSPLKILKSVMENATAVKWEETIPVGYRFPLFSFFFSPFFYKKPVQSTQFLKTPYPVCP